ncbi:uncharacterized protein [Montipora foliosa]|uniref:uncharacterized protein n=1 Tax=Montipora foliosa TaxID=591990 RepID=UPI0035F1F2AE
MLVSTWVVVLTFVVVGISKEGSQSTLDLLIKITEEKFKAAPPGPFPKCLNSSRTNSSCSDFSLVMEPPSSKCLNASGTNSSCPDILRVMEPPFPKSLNASCMLMPPFVTWNPNSSDRQTSKSNATVNQINGILPYILNLTLNMCCAAFKKNETVVSYQHHPVQDKSELHKAIMKDEVHLIYPVQSDDDKKYKKHLPYLKLFESPGIVLIRSRDSISRGIQNWSAAVRSCWPIVVLTVLLSIVAGICVWALETKKNSKEFGSPFCYGIFDGFWWAFVTMATVGYGDKTPKSLMARLFSVIWIMIGITLCSMLTATLSSAFTNVTVDYYGVLSERKVGVVKDSIALQKAVNLGANVKVFEDLNEVHNALVNKSVDGILEEMFTATEYFELHYENSSLSIVHFYEEKHGYGIALNSQYVDGFGKF